MSDFKKLLITTFAGKVKINELLADHTTFKIGGPADFFIEVKTKEEMIKAINLAKEFKMPFFILGGGSNILVSDRGFRGLVIKNRIEGIKILGYEGGGGKKCEVRKVKIKVGSGTTINHLVRFTISEGLEGIEDFLGLPGTVGGAVFGNSHFKGKKINDYVVSIEKKENVIFTVVFKLNVFKDKKLLWEKAEKALEYRKKTQPYFSASAGCIFKNISKNEAEKLKTPSLTQSTGYLIDQCNLKGKKIDDCQVSLIHANFIVNLNQAKAKDVIKLINLIKAKVKEKFNISLKEEIKYVGFKKI